MSLFLLGLAPAVPIIHHAGRGDGFLTIWQVLALTVVVSAVLYLIFEVLPRGRRSK